MPLVTITTAEPWFPRTPQATSSRQVLTYHFGLFLPGMFAKHSEYLGLGSELPEAGVQVDFKCFHPLAINAPHLWVHCQLTETLRDKLRQSFENRLANLIKDWLNQQSAEYRPRSFALDVFFGPGHGRLLREGQPTIVW